VEPAAVVVGALSWCAAVVVVAALVAAGLAAVVVAALVVAALVVAALVVAGLAEVAAGAAVVVVAALSLPQPATTRPAAASPARTSLVLRVLSGRCMVPPSLDERIVRRTPAAAHPGGPHGSWGQHDVDVRSTRAARRR
jgi:hypothetical protein